MTGFVTRKGRRAVVATAALAVAAVLLVTGSARLLTAHESSSDTDAVGLDAEAVLAAMQTLRTPEGLLSSPPVVGARSLDATGWTASVLVRLGSDAVPIPTDVLDELAEGADAVPNGVWRAYFVGEVLRSQGDTPRPEDVDAVTRWIRSDGWIEERDSRASPDVPASVLSTWAAVSVLRAADRPVPPATLTRVRSALAACEGNDFVRVHLMETLAMARPDEQASFLKDLSRCPATPAELGPGAPRNEADLLLAYAEARRSALLGHVDPDRQQDLRRFLSPQPFMSFDPWWAHYALEGYLAAGGAAADYSGVGRDLRSFSDEQGVAHQVGSPSVSVQGMYFAVQAAQSLGLDPAELVDGQALLRYGADHEYRTWGDADIAVWGDTLYALGAALDEDLAKEVRAAASSCASLEVTPPIARRVGRCRTVLEHYGGSLPPLRLSSTTDWGTQPGLILVDVTAELGMAPDEQAVRRAVADLAAAPEGVPTTVLAAVPRVSTMVGTPLGGEAYGRIVSELGRRHGRDPLAALYAVQDDGSFPDFASTNAVTQMVRAGEG